MRIVLQRTSGCEVWIDSARFSTTGPGLLILFGTQEGDTEASAAWLADKAVNLRIFEDDDGKMNRSLLDITGDVMIVSQFTLYADCRKGRRPSFNGAMEPVAAERLYNHFVERVTAAGPHTETGSFGAKMDVRFNNDGPVTVIIDHDA